METGTALTNFILKRANKAIETLSRLEDKDVRIVYLLWGKRSILQKTVAGMWYHIPATVIFSVYFLLTSFFLNSDIGMGLSK